jgi:hypothetical protein
LANLPVEETFINPFDGAALTLTRLFIPARLTDNPALLMRDPGYVARLQQSGSEALVKAWLEGDWSVIEGAFFDKWSGRNIVAPFQIPALWTRIRSFDWGYAAPFSVGWWAVVSDPWQCGAVTLPRGALVRYREWYGSNGRPNQGLRLEAEAVAAGIFERERQDGKIALGVADPSIFREDGGPSIGERLRRAGLAFRPADNTRVGKAGALSGWDQLRARIVGDGETPMLFVFDTCRDFIRTVPVLRHDPMRPEDLDTAAEDHIADETRYACLSRPMIARAPQAPTRADDAWRREWGRGSGGPDSWKVL